MKQTSSQPRLDGKIPGRIKYTFALGALGKDMIYGMIATFSMIYFTDIIKVNPVFIGVMFFVAKLWDAFNDLFMGMIVDNTRSRWGKFIPWLVIGTLVNSIVFVVLFTDFHLDGVGLCVFATAAYILWGMTYTIMSVNHRIFERIFLIGQLFLTSLQILRREKKFRYFRESLQVSVSHLLLQALVFKLLRLSAAAQQIRQVITDLQS